MLDKLFDLDHPFFKPLWLRIAVVASCLAWAVFEAFGGSPAWAAAFGGVGLYSAYRFFFAFNPRDKP